MRDGGNGITIIIVVVAIAVWFWQGDPARDMRRISGQQTYEDQTRSLESFMLSNRVGSSPDVWLVKSTYVPEKVAVFFGYVDDWGACHEFMTFYVQRYPLDSYSCEYAR